MNDSNATKRISLLVLRSQSGDRAALDALLESVQHELFGYLTKILHNDANAEDALQATLMQAARKLKWLQQPRYFRAWIYRIAGREAFRILKQSKQRCELLEPDFINDLPEREVAHSDRSALVEMIPAWLETLTPKGREVLVLHYLQGFTTQQVAEILGIPVGTARSRISYSLACIRKQIDQQKEKSE